MGERKKEEEQCSPALCFHGQRRVLRESAAPREVVENPFPHAFRVQRRRAAIVSLALSGGERRSAEHGVQLADLFV